MPSPGEMVKEITELCEFVKQDMLGAPSAEAFFKLGCLVGLVRQMGDTMTAMQEKLDAPSCQEPTSN